MHRALPAVLTAIVLGLAGLLAAPGASAADPTITSTELQFEVTVGPDNDTTCLVDADIHVPSHRDGRGSGARGPDDQRLRRLQGRPGRRRRRPSAARATSRSPTPVWASRTAAARSRSTTPTTTARPPSSWSTSSAAPRRTRPATPSTSTPPIAQDAPGDPKVGMIGGSYGGQVQFAAASPRPRIDALIPIITWNDLSYSLAPNNTSFDARRHLHDARRAQEAVDVAVLRRRHRRRHPGLGGRPEPQRRLPQLRRPGLPVQGPARGPRLARPGDAGLRAARQRHVVRRGRHARRRCSCRGRRTRCSTCRRRRRPTARCRRRAPRSR